MKKINLANQRFGKLIAIKDSGRRDSSNNKHWVCKCDCGNITEVSLPNLRTGHTKSCGCFRVELPRRHGDGGGNHKRSRIYSIWSNMKQRCYNSNFKSYKWYGNKNRKICSRWKNDYIAFKRWALANGYQDSLTIDRIDNDGNYCPENCQWITLVENAIKSRNA